MIGWVLKIYFNNKTSKPAELVKPKVGCLVYVENPNEKELEELEKDTI